MVQSQQCVDSFELNWRFISQAMVKSAHRFCDNHTFFANRGTKSAQAGRARRNWIDNRRVLSFSVNDFLKIIHRAFAG